MRQSVKQPESKKLIKKYDGEFIISFVFRMFYVLSHVRFVSFFCTGRSPSGFFFFLHFRRRAILFGKNRMFITSRFSFNFFMFTKKTHSVRQIIYMAHRQSSFLHFQSKFVRSAERIVFCGTERNLFGALFLCLLCKT